MSRLFDRTFLAARHVLLALASLLVVQGTVSRAGPLVIRYTTPALPRIAQAPATDLELTFDKTPVGGFNSKAAGLPMMAFEKTAITGTTIRFFDGEVKADATIREQAEVMVSFAPNTKEAKLTNAEWSFPEGPNRKITVSRIKVAGGKVFNPGGVLEAFVEISNDDVDAMLIESFALAKDVPEAHFGDSDAQLDALQLSNLFIDEGTAVAAASSFTLAPGETRRFELGQVDDLDYLVSSFSFSGSSSPEDVSGLSFGLNVIVPEPSSVALLAIGAVGLAAWSRRRR